MRIYSFGNYIFFFCSLALIWQLTACKKNPILPQVEGKDLSFEMDTLSFDTVFSQMGSATRKFKVYNPSNRRLVVKNIYLSGGEYSDFKLNIDGKNTFEVQDLEIPPFDSIYIRANVLVDPNNGDMLRRDSIIFETDGGFQQVQLEAFGWNANYIVPRRTLFRYTNTTLTLDPSKPNVILGQLYMDSSSTLVIPAGTEVFMFGGPSTRPQDRARIIIGHNSTIEINQGGNLTNPVEIKTHRLEEDYQEVPFQHDGIYLAPTSVNNVIDGCIIRNAVDGIFVDSLSVNTFYKLEMHSTHIYNVDRSCILARQAAIYAENCIFANSNQFNIIALRGGIYDFNHCTMVNYGVNPFIGRNEPIVSIRDFEIQYDANGNEVLLVSDVIADFENCIIHGSKEEEFEWGQNTTSPRNWDLTFDHCFMKLDTFSTGLVDCILNEEPYFEDVDEYLYYPDSTISLLIDGGKALNSLDAPANMINSDAEGNSRNDAAPDIGAFEFQ